MNRNQFLIIGAMLASVSMIGCAKKFETTVTKAKPAVVAPSAPIKASNTPAAATTSTSNSAAATPAGSGVSSESSTVPVASVPAQCAAALQVVPNDIEVSGGGTSDFVIQGFFDAFETPQYLSLSVKEDATTPTTQSFNVYNGTAGNTYSMPFSATAECLNSLCEAYVLVLESKSADPSCKGSTVQLVLYRDTNNNQTYSITNVGETLSFEDLKFQVTPL